MPEMFDEHRLRRDIVEVWGEHGAHVEVFDHIVAIASANLVPAKIAAAEPPPFNPDPDLVEHLETWDGKPPDDARCGRLWRLLKDMLARGDHGSGSNP